MTNSHGATHPIDTTADDPLREQDRFQEAINEYREQLKTNGYDYLTWLKLGDALLGQRNPTLLPISLACYRNSLDLHADNPAAYHKLGTIFKLLGRQEEAIAALKKALDLAPGLIRARFTLLDILCPILYEKEEDILSSRAAYAGQLNELCETIDLDGPEAIVRAAGAVGKYPFHLAYQGYDDCSLQRKYGNLTCRIQAARYPQWSKPLPPPPQKSGEPLRIGIVSGFFHEHATWNFPISGLLKALDRKRFVLYGYHTGSRCDHNTDLARLACTRFVEHDFSLTSLCGKILADRLHLLLYPEIGMNQMAVRLSALRLAPVQCVSWGHPTTSGLPTMDYFLGSDLMEPADGASHYTENLIRLPNLGVYFPPPEIEAVGMERAEPGFKEDAVLYLCLQSLFKYLPHYDEVFPRIARFSGNCRFVFTASNMSSPAVNIFRRRLAHVFSKYGMKSEDYISFIPYLAYPEYLGLYRSGDVFLDSIGWSGCNTTMDAIACDLPVVTLPGHMMRGRQSMAMLKMMDVTDTVANSLDDYVRIAAGLGTDRQWREKIRERVAANKHRLYADRSCIDYLENFFEKAVAHSRQQWHSKE
jgi:predicted O-linked N-acetylglucosamine transferase (SPINDLY family)